MKKLFAAMLVSLLSVPSVWAGLPDTILKVKPAVVGVGTLLQTRRPPAQLKGTGFVVGNGHYVVTNAHVIPEILNDERLETLAIFSGQGKDAKVIEAKLVKTDPVHDLALLKIVPQLPAMQLGRNEEVREGEEYAFTGFPIGAILGLYPVTHRGMVSAITPVAIPMDSTKQLDVRMIRALREPYNVYQLDGTAYPGNSGSPLYHQETGRVLGVINKVFVKETKEKVLENPSGISYAIPVKFVRELLEEAKVPY